MKSAHTQGQLFSLGRINADFQVRVERCPDPSETLVAKDFLVAGGGKSAAPLRGYGAVDRLRGVGPVA